MGAIFPSAAGSGMGAIMSKWFNTLAKQFEGDVIINPGQELKPWVPPAAVDTYLMGQLEM